MHHARHQKHQQDKRRERERADVLGKEHVGQHHHRREGKLHDRPVARGDVHERAVQDHDGGVEAGRDEAEHDAAQSVQTGAQHVRHQHHPEHGDEGAEPLAKRDLLSEDDRREQDHDHRRHVVAHGRRGDGGVVVRLKEADPVDGEQYAENDEFPEIALHRRPVDWVVPHGAHDQQKRKADHGAGEGHHAGREGDIAPHDADAAEDEHGEDELISVGEAFFHGNTRFW